MCTVLILSFAPAPSEPKVMYRCPEAAPELRLGPQANFRGEHHNRLFSLKNKPRFLPKMAGFLARGLVAFHFPEGSVPVY